MKHCYKCGTPLEDSANFCSICGANNQYGSADSFKVRMGFMITGILLFGMAALILVAQVFLGGPSSVFGSIWILAATSALFMIMAFTRKGDKRLFQRFPIRKGIFITVYIVVSLVIMYIILFSTLDVQFV